MGGKALCGRVNDEYRSYSPLEVGTPIKQGTCATCYRLWWQREKPTGAKGGTAPVG